MIYKFIDEHGAEITVNSLSQLQTLVDEKTIKQTMSNVTIPKKALVNVN